MHRFVCPNGHISRSAARDIGACGHSMCDGECYRVVAANELLELGVNAHDCVRRVEAAGDTYSLHLRAGVAYTDAMRNMAETMRSEQDDDGPSIVACVVDSATAYLVQWWGLAYGTPEVMAQ